MVRGLNVNEISNTLGLARRKVAAYINLLENTFVLIKTNPYYKNVRSQITKMPKFYWFDLGIRNQLLSNFSSLDVRTDSGALFENFIFNELRSAPGKKIFFYRTTNKSEVDFVVEQANNLNYNYTHGQVEYLDFRRFTLSNKSGFDVK